MMRTSTITCDKCGIDFEFRYRIQIDAVTSPQLKEELLAGNLHRHSCSACHSETMIMTPTVYWAESWVSVVHAMRPGGELDVNEVAQRTLRLLDVTRPNRAQLPHEVRVMGGINQLTYMLKHPEEANPCPFSDLALPNWNSQQDVWEELANAFLKHNLPELAFQLYFDLVNYLPELWDIRKVREELELIACAADDDWAAAGKQGLAPTEAYQELRHLLLSDKEDPYGAKPRLAGDATRAYPSGAAG